MCMFSVQMKNSQVHLRGWGRSDLGLGVTRIASEPVQLYTSNLSTTRSPIEQSCQDEENDI